MPIYIIEHLDPELYDWSLMEYTHISNTVGKENVWFTNITKEEDKERLRPLGTVYEVRVQDMKLNPHKTCLLDPQAGGVLSTHDCTEWFEYLVFGGILGNDPPDQRTGREFAKLDCNKRNLGPRQMSTNTAVYVTKQIADGKQFADLQFIDDLTIPVADGEEIILPFRFVSENGTPVLPQGYIEMAKKDHS